MTTSTSARQPARTSGPATPTPSFDSLGVPARLVADLAARGITEPFPIQAATLPDALAGRDVLGRGRTGSGKTLAFSLPLVTRLSGAKRAAAGRPRGLVLAPTRELATQIAQTLTPLARVAGLQVTTIFGGVGQNPQVSALRSGIDIVVACPGRLEDLKGQGHVSLDAVEITVLDEADHMADLGFLPGVTRILAATPAGGQRMLFSATLDAGVDKLVKRFLSTPVTHSVDPASSPVATLTHHLFEVPDVTAKRELVELLASGTGRRLLFMRTKHQARQMARRLTAAGIPAADLHGNLSQGARERNLAAFSSGEVRVMVATDIAARGIHVDDVDLVVHVDPPAEHKAYLHRSGRTARAGAGGDVVTILLPEQRGDVASLTRAAKIDAKVRPADAAAVARLVGEVAPRVAPQDAPSGAAQKPSGNGGGKAGGGKAGGRSGARGAAKAGTAQAGSPKSGARSGASAGARDGRPGTRADQADRPAAGGGRRRRGQRSAADGLRGESRGQGVRGGGAPAQSPATSGRGSSSTGRTASGAGRAASTTGRTPGRSQRRASSRGGAVYSTSTTGGSGFVQMSSR
ncbi:superfamily II DNA/RNA helicase [Salana multivorans]|uniref:Superfamily II DNA/RNA helicase n=1 Tax=Salana multivorans TaxID=120377 RepID=A0A3N2DCN6_9MICO|nr:superfamily II DNA/RNA helicase [Salana multivorans]